MDAVVSPISGTTNAGRYDSLEHKQRKQISYNNFALVRVTPSHTAGCQKRLPVAPPHGMLQAQRHSGKNLKGMIRPSRTGGREFSYYIDGRLSTRNPTCQRLLNGWGTGNWLALGTALPQEPLKRSPNPLEECTGRKAEQHMSD